MADNCRDNSIEWLTGDDGVTVTFSQRKYISLIKKFAEERPDEVIIVHENKDGSIVAHLPLSYIKISKKREVSEERKEAASERFKKMWEEKNKDKQ